MLMHFCCILDHKRNEDFVNCDHQAADIFITAYVYSCRFNAGMCLSSTFMYGWADELITSKGRKLIPTDGMMDGQTGWEGHRKSY